MPSALPWPTAGLKYDRSRSSFCACLKAGSDAAFAQSLGEVRVEALVRVAAVHLAQGGQILREDVARLAPGVQLDEVQHVAGAGAEADDARGVAAAVADVLDVSVLGLPVERGVLRAGHQLHGDVLLRRIVEPGGRAGSAGARRGACDGQRHEHQEQAAERMGHLTDLSRFCVSCRGTCRGYGDRQ